MKIIKRALYILTMICHLVAIVLGMILAIPYWIITGRFTLNDYFQMVDKIDAKYFQELTNK